MSGGKGRHVRMRTAQERKKALAQLDELRRSGRVERALVLADMKDGSLQILGQECTPDEIPRLLWEAAEALRHVLQRQEEEVAQARPEEKEEAPPGPRGEPYPGEPGGLLNGAWRSYAEAVMPTNAPIVQRIESRRAFYAGATALMDAIMRGLSAGEDPTQEDMARMDRIAHELQAFAEAVKEERA